MTWHDEQPEREDDHIADDQLALLFTCCHPALDLGIRVPLTLRAVCGLSTSDIASVYLLPEATMAQRLVRAKRKIRDAGIALRVPDIEELAARIGVVLRVIYLMFTAGHRAASGPELVRPDLSREAIRLARELAGLMPGEPEIRGLLALLLLTDARRPARMNAAGQVVLLADQDRGRWELTMVEEGLRLVDEALREGRPGAYQLEAAIAACHACAASFADTDWLQIVALYDELYALRPTGVVAANRAVAVAMAHGPAAGLRVLDELLDDPALARWAPLYLARGELLLLADRTPEAIMMFEEALLHGLPEAERRLIQERTVDLRVDERRS